MACSCDGGVVNIAPTVIYSGDGSDSTDWVEFELTEAMSTKAIGSYIAMLETQGMPWWFIDPSTYTFLNEVRLVYRLSNNPTDFSGFSTPVEMVKATANGNVYKYGDIANVENYQFIRIDAECKLSTYATGGTPPSGLDGLPAWLQGSVTLLEEVP